MTPLTPSKIYRIVHDLAPDAKGLRRVGVVGSYARNDYNSESDVDLVFFVDDQQTDESLTRVAERLKSIFMNQFRVELDIVRYNTIIQYLEQPEKLTFHQLGGYKKMLEDLIWIWEWEDKQ